MAAALTRHQSATQENKGPQRIVLARDLMEIADLIELCFGERLDSAGRSAVSEMKAVARLGPLLWLLAPLDWLGVGIGLGYVWRENGRVIGNASLYRGGEHPQLGKGWLIANVAVHPDHRRQGIARELMNACIALARQRGGRWMALQVEADNDGAVALYDELGFRHYETLEMWKTTRLPARLPDYDRTWNIRRRAAEEAEAEVTLIYERARRGAMAWTRILEPGDVRDPLNTLFGFTGIGGKDHWVLTAPEDPHTLLGALWVETQSLARMRLTLFLDPGLQDASAKQALLLYVLHRRQFQNRLIRLEKTADPALDELLDQIGFRQTRRLIQMRRPI